MFKGSISFEKDNKEYRVAVFGSRESILHLIQGLEVYNVLLSNIFISECESKNEVK